VSTSERDVERKRLAEQALHREARKKRIKEIIWASVIASVSTTVVLLLLGVLTTQHVVRRAREEGAKDVLALKASICFVRFEHRPDAADKMKEFNALSLNDKETAIRKFITDEKLAKMPGEDTPAPGAIDKCVDAIVHS
jgi:hypothetical protein